MARYDRLHLWRKERAIRRGVESDVVLSREAMWALAEARPQTWDALAQINEIGPIRRQMYGAELLQILKIG